MMDAYAVVIEVETQRRRVEYIEATIKSNADIHERSKKQLLQVLTKEFNAHNRLQEKESKNEPSIFTAIRAREFIFSINDIEKLQAMEVDPSRILEEQCVGTSEGFFVLKMEGFLHFACRPKSQSAFDNRVSIVACYLAAKELLDLDDPAYKINNLMIRWLLNRSLELYGGLSKQEKAQVQENFPSFLGNHIKFAKVGKKQKVEDWYKYRAAFFLANEFFKVKEYANAKNEYEIVVQGNHQYMLVKKAEYEAALKDSLPSTLVKRKEYVDAWQMNKDSMPVRKIACKFLAESSFKLIETSGQEKANEFRLMSANHFCAFLELSFFHHDRLPPEDLRLIKSRLEALEETIEDAVTKKRIKDALMLYGLYEKELSHRDFLAAFLTILQTKDEVSEHEINRDYHIAHDQLEAADDKLGLVGLEGQYDLIRVALKEGWRHEQGLIKGLLEKATSANFDQAKYSPLELCLFAKILVESCSGALADDINLLLEVIKKNFIRYHHTYLRHENPSMKVFAAFMQKIYHEDHTPFDDATLVLASQIKPKAASELLERLENLLDQPFFSSMLFKENNIAFRKRLFQLQYRISLKDESPGVKVSVAFMQKMYGQDAELFDENMLMLASEIEPKAASELIKKFETLLDQPVFSSMLSKENKAACKDRLFQLKSNIVPEVKKDLPMDSQPMKELKSMPSPLEVKKAESKSEYWLPEEFTPKPKLQTMGAKSMSLPRSEGRAPTKENKSLDPANESRDDGMVAEVVTTSQGSASAALDLVSVSPDGSVEIVVTEPSKPKDNKRSSGSAGGLSTKSYDSLAVVIESSAPTRAPFQSPTPPKSKSKLFTDTYESFDALLDEQKKNGNGKGLSVPDKLSANTSRMHPTPPSKEKGPDPNLPASSVVPVSRLPVGQGMSSSSKR